MAGLRLTMAYQFSIVYLPSQGHSAREKCILLVELLVQWVIFDNRMMELDFSKVFSYISLPEACDRGRFQASGLSCTSCCDTKPLFKTHQIPAKLAGRMNILSVPVAYHPWRALRFLGGRGNLRSTCLYALSLRCLLDVS